MFFFLLRPHQGIYGFCPYAVHTDPHISSIVARKNNALRTDRQAYLSNVFSNKSHNVFAPGDKVLIKVRKKHFDKYNPIQNPQFRPGVYTIRSADFSTLPPLYSLVEFSDSRRRLYGWEMYKLNREFHRTAQRQDRVKPETQILVQDVFFTDESRLRSGKVVPGKANVKYQVSRQGNTEVVDARHLHLWKRALGRTLIYGPAFSQPEKAQYKI